MKNAVITVLAVLVLVMGGYLVYDKIIDKDDNKVQDNIIKKSEELDINSYEVRSLFAPFGYHTNFDKEELYYKDKVILEDLSTEYKNRLAFAKYFYENKKYEGTYKIDEFISLDTLTSSKLEEYYKKLFGNNDKYIAQSFDSFGIDRMFMDYIKEQELYTASQNGGDADFTRYGNQLYKAIKTENTIELYEYVVVFNYSLSKNLSGVYKNIEDAYNFENAIKESYAENITNLIKYDNSGYYFDDLSEYKEEASQYKLIFKKENGNYIFESIEKIK